MLAILSNLLVIAACFGVGLLLLRFFPDSFPHGEKVVYSGLAGFGFTSFIFFAVGQIYFRWPLVLLTLIGFAVLGLYQVASNHRLWRFPPFSFHLSFGHAIPAAIVAFVLILTFTAAFAPPAGDWNSDSIAYHLLGPRVWVRDGLIRPVPDNCHTAFPVAGEVIFAALISLAGPVAANLSAVWTLALFLCVIYFLARRLELSSLYALWCAALVAIMPAALLVMVNVPEALPLPFGAKVSV
jgi:hypothetical protein